MTVEQRLLRQIRGIVPLLLHRGAAVSGQAAAHVHLAAATKTKPGGPPRYFALTPRRIEVVCAGEIGSDLLARGVVTAADPVTETLRARLDLFAARVALGGRNPVPALSREAALAQLLCRSPLDLGLAGLIVRLCRRPPLDVDAVREILKAARQADRFQPLLELLAAA